MPEMNAITVLHLNKRFGEHTAIADLSFTVPHGKRMGIFAPSGSGKTTLLQILAGLQQADSGSARVADPNPAVIFQEPRLFPHLTVEENIFLPFHVQKKEISAPVWQEYAAWLDVCELSEFQRHYPHQLSGGMKQKVALVRGFLQHPAMALLDEPFQSIGRQAKQAIIQHLLATNPGLSMLLVTHDPEEVQLLAHATLYFHANCLSRYNLVETNGPEFARLGAENYFLKQKEIL